MQVVDLEYVESRQAIVSLEPPTLDFIGSDKVRFVDCDLAISKLEPYLGKVMLNPMDCLGSTEWVGLRCTTDYPILTTAYLLMLPDMCEAYRRLQSGKRHARFDPKEFLGLMVELPDESIATEIEKEIKNRRNQIFDTRSRARTVRESIDVLFDE